MTPDAVREALHVLEIRMVEQLSALRVEVSGVLDLKNRVAEHDEILKNLQLEVSKNGLLSWGDVGRIITVLIAIGGFVLAFIR